MKLSEELARPTGNAEIGLTLSFLLSLFGRSSFNDSHGSQSLSVRGSVTFPRHARKFVLMREIVFNFPVKCLLKRVPEALS